MKFLPPVAIACLSLASVNGALLPSTYTGTKGLHELAKAQGKYMGTATDNGELTDKYYVAALQNVKDFGMITPGNAMKWDATEYTQNVFNYTKADAIVSLADKMGAQVRCHTLLWHQQVPNWVQNLSKEEMLSALEIHITKVMTHFGDSCHAWDVANEVMGDDATYRKSFWYAKTGTNYITTAFKTANAVKKSLGLKTKLYYNDYNTNTVNAKSTAVLEMIQTLLLDKNIGIDGMGFQSHSSYSDTSTAKDMVTNLERFTALGLEVAYTELDVKTSSPTPSEDEQEQQVQVYTNVISAFQQVKDCVGVTIWDFDDSYTWLENSAPLPWYQPNGKGTGLVRKRAYDGIAAGWGASTATSDTSSSSPKEASVQGESSVEKEPPTAASSTTDTTSDSADYESTSSSLTEALSGSDSATQNASSGDAETTGDGDAAASATENSDETSLTSSNTPTSPTESSSNAETTAQKPTARKSGACTRLLRK